jgi:hypothetical protein
MTHLVPASSNGPTGGVWFDLEALLSLPLEANALATLWREALERLQQGPMTERIQRTCDALIRAIGLHELRQARADCLAGDWLTGLNRLVGLETSVPSETMAATLMELLPVLHHQLIDLAEASPSRCPFEPDDRAELLWQAHRWLSWLEQHGDEAPERIDVIREQICRYGAIAWMSRPQPRAQRRSIPLLLKLLELEPEAHGWALQACRGQLGALIAAVTLAPVPDRPSLQQLVDWCNAVATYTPLDTAMAATLGQTLTDLQAGLALWSGWRQDQETGRTRPNTAAASAS